MFWNGEFKPYQISQCERYQAYTQVNGEDDPPWRMPITKYHLGVDFY